MEEEIGRDLFKQKHLIKICKNQKKSVEVYDMGALKILTVFPWTFKKCEAGNRYMKLANESVTILIS